MSNRISTQTMARRDRRNAWRAASSRAIVRQEIEPLVADFAGELEIVELGRLRLVRIESDAVLVTHGSQITPISTDERCYLLRLQIAGRAEYRQQGSQVLLGAGDFLLGDAMRPYSIRLDEPGVLLVMRIPQALLQLYAPAADYCVGVRISGQVGYRRAIFDFLANLWAIASKAEAPLQDATTAILSMLNAAFSEHLQSANAKAPSRTGRRIIEYIDANLADPGLSPATVAAALGISIRYLHRIFSARADIAQSLSRYIVERRLLRCRDVLEDRAQDHRTVTQIALSNGFNNVAHFTTIFRRAFGQPPGAFRAGLKAGPAISGPAAPDSQSLPALGHAR